jgi:hypothetical protein
MRTTILSLLGLALSSSIASAAPNQRRAPIERCWKGTYGAPCVIEADANLLDTPVKAAVKGVCRPVLSGAGVEKIVSEPAQIDCLVSALEAGLFLELLGRARVVRFLFWFISCLLAWFLSFLVSFFSWLLAFLLPHRCGWGISRSVDVAFDADWLCE